MNHHDRPALQQHHVSGQGRADGDVVVAVVVHVAWLRDRGAETAHLVAGSPDELRHLEAAFGVAVVHVDDAPVLVRCSNSHVRVAVAVQVTQAGNARAETAPRALPVNALYLKGSLEVFFFCVVTV